MGILLEIASNSFFFLINTGAEGYAHAGLLEVGSIGRFIWTGRFVSVTQAALGIILPNKSVLTWFVQ